jgi:hypothetical protein
MVGSAELHCIGVRQVKASYLGLRSFERGNNRYRLSVRI